MTKKTAKKSTKKPARSKKPKAITFDELMTHRTEDGIEFNGHQIKVVSETCVSVPAETGDALFHRGDYLVTLPSGDLTVCHHDDFSEKYG